LHGKQCPGDSVLVTSKEYLTSKEYVTEQCPGDSVLVGNDLNTDPYGIAVPLWKGGGTTANHPLLETLTQVHPKH